MHLSVSQIFLSSFSAIQLVFIYFSNYFSAIPQLFLSFFSTSPKHLLSNSAISQQFLSYFSAISQLFLSNFSGISHQLLSNLANLDLVLIYLIHLLIFHLNQKLARLKRIPQISNITNFFSQLLATISAAWTCVGHGLLTGYTAQAIPSMMKEDSTIKMTETHKTWISTLFFLTFEEIVDTLVLFF